MKENTCPRMQPDVRFPVLQRAQEEGELSRLRASVSCGLKTIICKPQNKPKTIQIKGKTNQNKPKSNQNKCFFQAQTNRPHAQELGAPFSFSAKQLPAPDNCRRFAEPSALGDELCGSFSISGLGFRVSRRSGNGVPSQSARSQSARSQSAESYLGVAGWLGFDPCDLEFISYFEFSISSFPPQRAEVNAH